MNITKTKLDFANPLNFRCAPNSAAADYVAESSFERFLAYGLVVCHYDLLEADETLDAILNDVYWLRRNFLEEVGIALDALPLMLEESHNENRTHIYYEGDHSQNSIAVSLKKNFWKNEEPDDNRFSLEWCFSELHNDLNDSTLEFILVPSEGDNFSIWLRLDAIANKKKTGVLRDAWRAHGHAMQINEKLKGE